MATNIANMGFQYPAAVPNTELVPLNSGCVNDLKKLKIGPGSSGQTMKDSGRALFTVKDSKMTSEALTSAFMGPLSDNHR